MERCLDISAGPSVVWPLTHHASHTSVERVGGPHHWTQSKTCIFS